MDERNDNSSVEKMEEVMLPGFRFHPTDEELVGFYLRRKIQHRPLSIELIKQLDIYKYDPWDLPKMATTGEKEWYFYCPRDRKYRNSARPKRFILCDLSKMATTGEKEWYFYCPRDRKYRNSARPNRVTGAGFWKATGTDRPIYSSKSSKCIGLKKSLVFYKGRAAKGIKTDWMMHEFRLPSTINNNNESGPAATRYVDKHIHIPANDAWAICRIFKKANSTAQRALSHSWVSPIILPETSHDDMQTEHFHGTTTTTITETAVASSSVIQFGNSSSSEVIQQQQQQSSSSIASFSPILVDPTNFPYNNKCTISPMMMMMSGGSDHDQLSHHEVSTSKCHDHDLLLNTMICPFPTTNTTIDASSLLLNMSSSVFGDLGKSGKDLDYACGDGSGSGSSTTTTNVSISQEQCSNFLMAVVPDQDIRRNYFVATTQQDHHHDQKTAAIAQKDKEQWDSMQSLVGIPVNFPMNMADDAWKSNLIWDSSPCPSDISTTYSTNNNCYT